MSRSGVFFASLLVSLGRPAWWLLALAGFLARGGILLAILPIVNLPSPLVLSNLVAPIIVPLALGHVDAGVVAALAIIVAGLLAWLIVGGLIGAATDLIQDAKRELHMPGDITGSFQGTAQVFQASLATLPLQSSSTAVNLIVRQCRFSARTRCGHSNPGCSSIRSRARRPGN